MSKRNQNVEIFVCGEKFLISKDELSCFRFLDTMVNDIEKNEKIEFDTINPETFKILLEYVQNMYRPPNKNWKKDYFEKYRLKLGIILQCSQFLDIAELQADTKNELIKHIQTCTNSSDFNTKFNIDHNITKEKSEKVSDQLKWAEYE